MQIVRVTIRAEITSFRHPFFVTGRQPTSDMPPPSTIYGHCASALGDWPNQSEFFFGIHFVYCSRGLDLEHQHIAEALSPRTFTHVPTPKGNERATTSITVQPVSRDFLFGVTMTLYLSPEIGHAFRRPVYPVVLGRSQDLAEIMSVEDITLERAARARVEHTLLPFSVRPYLGFGSTVLLSRYISPPPERYAYFERYIVLHDSVLWGESTDPNQSFIQYEGVTFDDLWVDPTIVDDEGFARGIWIHRITGEQ